MWLDWNWALPRVSYMPGVTAWSRGSLCCSLAILSSGLHLAIEHPAPSSSCVCIRVHPGVHGARLRACKMMTWPFTYNEAFAILLRKKEKKKNFTGFSTWECRAKFSLSRHISISFKLVILLFPLCTRNWSSHSKYQDEYDCTTVLEKFSMQPWRENVLTNSWHSVQ